MQTFIDPIFENINGNEDSKVAETEGETFDGNVKPTVLLEKLRSGLMFDEDEILTTANKVLL